MTPAVGQRIAQNTLLLVLKNIHIFFQGKIHNFFNMEDTDRLNIIYLHNEHCLPVSNIDMSCTWISGSLILIRTSSNDL